MNRPKPSEALPSLGSVSKRFAIDPTDLTALTKRLVDTARDRALLDVTYRTIDTPVGPLLIAATESGLVRVAFEREGFDGVLQAIAERVSPRIMRTPERLDLVATQIDEYFAGSRKAFDVQLDFSLSSGFRQSVQKYLPRIDYGSTRSYKTVAEEVGNPRAVRAVGTACATNPLPIVLPCHRVVRSDGSLGGYAGGVAAKQLLLEMETQP